MDPSMLKSVLPTDNLYKFIALCGATIVAVSLWVSQQNDDKLKEQSVRLAQLFRTVADGVQSLGDLEKVIVRDGDGNIVAVNSVPTTMLENPISAKPEDKEALRKFIFLSDAMLTEWAKVPFDDQDKLAWFKMKDVEEYTKRRYGFDDAQYQTYVDELPIAEFRVLRKPSNERASELRSTLRQAHETLEEAWRLQHIRERHDGLVRAGLCIGVTFTVVGFWCWFRLVQRHLDALLAQEVIDSRNKPRSA